MEGKCEKKAIKSGEKGLRGEKVPKRTSITSGKSKARAVNR